MIPSSTIFAFIVAAIFTLLLPIVILIVLAVKKKLSGLPLLLGVAAFFISQILLRIPILNILSGQEWYKAFALNFIPYALCLSLSAGLFEESARLGGALLLKRQRSYKDIISFGLGHGFCEVILLVGFTQINNIMLSMAINNGGGALTAALPAETLKTVVDQLTAVNPVHVYWGIAERFSAVTFHVFATMLVFKGVINRKWIYYVLAIAAHTLFNFLAVMLARYTGITITELVLLILALAAGVYVIKQKKDHGDPAM